MEDREFRINVKVKGHPMLPEITEEEMMWIALKMEQLFNASEKRRAHFHSFKEIK